MLHVLHPQAVYLADGACRIIVQEGVAGFNCPCVTLHPANRGDTRFLLQNQNTFPPILFSSRPSLFNKPAERFAFAAGCFQGRLPWQPPGCCGRVRRRLPALPSSCAPSCGSSDPEKTPDRWGFMPKVGPGVNATPGYAARCCRRQTPMHMHKSLGTSEPHRVFPRLYSQHKSAGTTLLSVRNLMP